MGLDSYLLKRGKTTKAKMLIALEGGKEVIQLAYWRKRYALHTLFLNFDNSDRDDLNCGEIPLTKDDLKEALEWFREDENADEINDGDIEMLKNVINDTDFENEEVFYYSWR